MVKRWSHNRTMKTATQTFSKTGGVKPARGAAVVDSRDVQLSPARQRLSPMPEAYLAGQTEAWPTINHQPTLNQFTTSNPPGNYQNATKCYHETGRFGSISKLRVATISGTDSNRVSKMSRKTCGKLPNATKLRAREQAVASAGQPFARRVFSVLLRSPVVHCGVYLHRLALPW